LIALIINAHSHSACDPNGNSHQQLRWYADPFGQALIRKTSFASRSIRRRGGQASPTWMHCAAHHHV